MEKNNYSQCGYEHRCKNKDCLNCPRKRKYKNLTLTLAEEIAIEDIAVCDVQSFLENKPKEFELLQDVMKKLMHKIFKNQRD